MAWLRAATATVSIDETAVDCGYPAMSNDTPAKAGAPDPTPDPMPAEAGTTPAPRPPVAAASAADSSSPDAKRRDESAIVPHGGTTADTTSDLRHPSSAASPPPTRRILGIDYFIGSVEQAVAKTLAGGLVVAPSGPGMAVDLVHSAEYREAVQSADLALTDSGYMILLWRLFTGEKLPRLSGLRFIRALLDEPALKAPRGSFWIMPSATESARNRQWLEARGYPLSDDDLYIAPFYGSARIDDPELIARIEARRPRVVMLCIGGGIQERVGCYLRRELSYRPGITCLGAAIAFETGGQASIPPWADRLMLGWLLRILSDPRKFGKRYAASIRLAPLLYRHRERLPPLRGKS